MYPCIYLFYFFLIRGRLFISVVANFLQVYDYGQILITVYNCNPQCVVLDEAQGKKILLFCFARPLCSHMPFRGSQS